MMPTDSPHPCRGRGPLCSPAAGIGLGNGAAGLSLRLQQLRHGRGCARVEKFEINICEPFRVHTALKCRRPADKLIETPAPRLPSVQTAATRHCKHRAKAGNHQRMG